MAQDDPISPDVGHEDPVPAAPESRKRPRLDLGDGRGGERKRGRNMFGILLGTLNKAKTEDQERSASDAAKKRAQIEQRLQTKLRAETDSVRKQEEAKKDKTVANRKEEDLVLRDSIYKLRQTRLPLLANFLVTSDVFTDDKTLIEPRRSHPPPLYYLPAILLPEQEDFINRRKAEVAEQVERERSLFLAEKQAGIEEIESLRQKVKDEEERLKEKEKEETMDVVVEDKKDDVPVAAPIEEEKKVFEEEEDKKEDEPVPMRADDDDAVEY